METHRNTNFIDVLKGFAIIFVLWGHSIQYCSVNSFDFFENWMFKIIYSFHMPFFMMISGYLFWYSVQNRKLHEILRHRTRSMIQPIIMCGLLAYISIYLLKDILMNGIKPLIGFICGGSGVSAFTRYWFLWSSLACCMVVAIAWKSFSIKCHRYLAMIFGMAFLCLFPSTGQSIFLYPYFVIGFLYHENEQKLKNRLKKFQLLPIVVFPVLMLFYKKKHYIYVSGLYSKQEGIVESIKIDIFRWVIGLFGCLFIIVCINYLFCKCGKKKLFSWISVLGKNSLQIYCLQSILLEGWFASLYHKLVEIIKVNPLAFNGFLYNLIFTPMIAVGFSLIILMIIHWLNKRKISNYMFGR